MFSKYSCLHYSTHKFKICQSYSFNSFHFIEHNVCILFVCTLYNVHVSVLPFILLENIRRWHARYDSICLIKLIASRRIAWNCFEREKNCKYNQTDWIKLRRRRRSRPNWSWNKRFVVYTLYTQVQTLSQYVRLYFDWP